MDTMTQSELVTELRQRFGDDPLTWAFICPACNDVASAADFRAALETHPRANRDGTPKIASDLLGQECIGRTLGALKHPNYNGRGCDWCAFGLLPGPLSIEMPDGHTAASFHIAEPEQRCDGCGSTDVPVERSDNELRCARCDGQD